MAKHDQRDPITTAVCAGCRNRGCVFCVDALRSHYTTTRLCNCGKAEHDTALERIVARERARWDTEPSGPRIRCEVCGMTSYHPDDIKTGYCAYCHKFTNGVVSGQIS